MAGTDGTADHADDDPYTYWVVPECPYPDECTAPSWKKTQKCVSYHSADDSCLQGE